MSYFTTQLSSVFLLGASVARILFSTFWNLFLIIKCQLGDVLNICDPQQEWNRSTAF